MATHSVLFVRKVLPGAMALLLMAGIGLAQESKKPAKPVKATVVFGTDVKVADKLLRAGEYRITANGETLVFSGATTRDRDGETFTFPCKGRALDAPADRTEINSTTDPSGVKVLRSVLLKGASMEYSFQ